MNEEKKSTRGVEVLRGALTTLPNTPGVYRMLNAKGEVLYVGKARALKNRVSNYVNLLQLTKRMQRAVMETATLEVTHTASEAEALLLEANLIKTLKPRFNILLRDDKSFPFITLSKTHAYPRIAKYRGARSKDAEFFGPFPSAGAVNETLLLLQKAFLLRPCADTVFKNRTRPCLQYQIKRCSAPCVGYISESDYAGLLAEARRYLSGKGTDIQQQLAAEMERLSEAQEFEKAAVLRDRIRALSQVQHEAPLMNAGLQDADVAALVQEGGGAAVAILSWRGGRYLGAHVMFPRHTEEVEAAEILSTSLAQHYQRVTPPKEILLSHMLPDGEALAEALSLLAHYPVKLQTPQRGAKQAVIDHAASIATARLKQELAAGAHQAEMLARMAELFQLAATPERIEVYDNSHVMGAHAVGGMIVATPAGFDKKSYRTFNIRSTDLTPGDDYAMLREVLTRRFTRALKDAGTLPDVALIDGGAAQLSTAMQVMEQLGISDVALIAISKGPDRNAGREWFHQPGREAFQLPGGDALLHYLQRLRDEAHRFAIGTHRNRRSRETLRSELDAIPGIGGMRKKALLTHFGSARGVAEASLAELQRIPGINAALAKAIYAHFH